MTAQTTTNDDPSGTRRPLAVARLASVAAAAFTLPLLFVGGSVTTYRVGLAVPDWPTTFGINMFLFDFINAPFGVQVEHTHRLYGAAVGLATIAVLLALWIGDRRRWMKGLGVVALVAVIIQGVLGGMRVTRASTLLAAVHGSFGQAFFALMVAIAALSSAAWVDAPSPRPDLGRLRRWTTLNFALVYLQIAVGAWFRHFGDPRGLGLHVALAVVVLVEALLLARRILLRRDESRALVPAARILAAAVVAQVVLGVVSLILLLPLDGVPHAVSAWQALARTAHQTNGAVLLAASTVLALRARRAFAAVPRVASEQSHPLEFATSGTRTEAVA